MTTTIRAFVFRTSMAWPSSAAPWCALIAVSTAPDNFEAIRRISWAGSHPEAMQAAYKLLADIDRALMDEVHASRASRRAQRCTECDEVVPEGKAHWKLSEDPCIVLGADQIDADLTADTYPMEVTA